MSTGIGLRPGCESTGCATDPLPATRLPSTLPDTLLFLAAAGGIAVFHAEVMMLAGNWKTSRMVAHLLGGSHRGTWGRCTLPVGRGRTGSARRLTRRERDTQEPATRERSPEAGDRTRKAVRLEHHLSTPSWTRSGSVKSFSGHTTSGPVTTRSRRRHIGKPRQTRPRRGGPSRRSSGRRHRSLP